MNPCVIKLDSQYLYTELAASLVHELLADVVTRYEGLFTFSDPHYPDGKPELLFKVLAEGYGLPICTDSLGIEVVDLRTVRIEAKAKSDDQWKEVFAGRILAATFARTINRQ